MIGVLLGQFFFTGSKEAFLQPKVSTEKGKQKSRLNEISSILCGQLKPPHKDNLNIYIGAHILLLSFCL
jgi:hypothetical protein